MILSIPSIELINVIIRNKINFFGNGMIVVVLTCLRIYVSKASCFKCVQGEYDGISRFFRSACPPPAKTRLKVGSVHVTVKYRILRSGHKVSVAQRLVGSTGGRVVVGSSLQCVVGLFEEGNGCGRYPLC